MADPVIEPVTELKASTEPKSQDTPPAKTILTEEPKPADPAQKVDGTKTEEEKPKEGQVVPEKYELKTPDGSPLDAGHTERIALFAKEQGLSQKQAQALLDREHSAVVSQKEHIETVKAQWLDTVRSDKELGGAALAENAEVAKRVIAKFGSESLKQALNETGLGNHPELVRFAFRIGKLMGGDKLVIGDPPAKKPKTREEKFYPNQGAQAR